MTRGRIVCETVAVFAIATAGVVAWTRPPSRAVQQSVPVASEEYGVENGERQEPVGWVFGRLVGIQPSAYPSPIQPSVGTHFSAPLGPTGM